MGQLSLSAITREKPTGYSEDPDVTKNKINVKKNEANVLIGSLCLCIKDTSLFMAVILSPEYHWLCFMVNDM